MRKRSLFIALFLIWSVVCGSWPSAFGAVPHLINYQGRVTDTSGNPLNGSYDLTFRIYDALTAGTLLWEENQTGVVVTQGLFGVMLGSATDLNIPFDKPYYLEIKVGTEVLSPRQQITSAGYAIMAEQSEKVKTDSADPTAGYLSDKTDATTLEVDIASHKMRVKDAGINKDKLKTAVGEVSGGNGTISILTLPGGEYGFYPQIKMQSTAWWDWNAQILGRYNSGNTGFTTYASVITLNQNASGSTYIYAKQRYVTASGMDHWIFLLIDNKSGEIIASYSAPDHPCYGNGGDPEKTPHPFLNYDPSAQTIVILDKPTVQALKDEAASTGKTILELINDDYKPNLSKAEPYESLHSGTFVDKTPKMIEQLPRDITVRKLFKLSAAEKISREHLRQQKITEAERQRQGKQNAKERALSKLADLGLTQDEVQALEEAKN